jgi:hypothetical protein
LDDTVTAEIFISSDTPAFNLKTFLVLPWGTRGDQIDPLKVELTYCVIHQPVDLTEFLVIFSKNTGEATIPITGLLTQFSASLYHLCINITLQDSSFQEWTDPKMKIATTRDSLII